MDRTYTFLFDPDPEGGYVVTCPALPGLVTHGATLEEARDMARDAMDGYIGTLFEDGEPIPDSDPPEMVPRYGRLAQALRDEPASPVLEQITTRADAAA
jgi:antitoxin HicB